MSTINPRIHVTTDAATRALLVQMAKRDNTSIAHKAAEYLQIGLELAEDVELASVAIDRMKTDRSKYLSHNKVWK